MLGKIVSAFQGKVLVDGGVSGRWIFIHVARASDRVRRFAHGAHHGKTDSSGRQRVKQDVLIRMTTPVGEPLEIPIHDLGPKEKPPKMVLVSGIHGNELNGIFVLARLAEHLKSRGENADGAPSLRERVLIIPAVNVLGLAHPHAHVALR